jgi:hypothetical protein
MINVRLEDGRGNGNYAKVNGEGELNVVVHPHPPRNEVSMTLPFRQYFTDDGTATGDSDMIVNGATTNVDFYITARPDYDIYIKTLTVQISDPGARLDQFGALTALTNGVEWSWVTSEEGEYELHEGIKDNLEFVKLSLGSPAFGAGTTAFRADTQGGAGEDTYLPAIDLGKTFGLPWGLRLRKGTQDKLVFKIKDNLTGLSTFNIIGYGVRF